MAQTTSFDFQIQGGMRANIDDVGVGLGSDEVTIASTGLEEMHVTLADDTAGQEFNAFVYGSDTIGAGATKTITLASVVDRFGVAFNPTVIRAAFFRLLTPDGTKKFRVGPLSDAAAVTFGMPTAGYKESFEFECFVNRYGWTTPITKVLIHNPGASTITVQWALGGKR
jgi:hypothetical protein